MSAWRMSRFLLACVLGACAPVVRADEPCRVFTDDDDDAVVRRTDAGNDGPLLATTVPPDLVLVQLAGWSPSAPTTDPYAGTIVSGESADVFRLDAVLVGLVNPPGTMGIGGLAYDPFRFGDSPLLGFIELDVDREKDTGGQLGGAAELRYLANVARFGARPEGSIGERVAESASDHDGSFYTGPQFERSGEDFALVLCGCHDVTLVSESGDGDGLFEAGETFVVRGRFFQRASGYQDASSMFGGSDPGLYDPVVDLRFSHDPSSDRTTVSLVYPLTMEGAALLRGEAVQAIDSFIDLGGSHSSVIEALQDLIDGANDLPLNGPVGELTDHWEGQRASDHLDPTRWRASALIGTAYAQPEPSLYVWTDVGFEIRPGDMNGDAFANHLDRDLVSSVIAAGDGTPDDADGVIDGVLTIADFGPNFSLYDIDGDGLIGPADVGAFLCAADLDRSGVVDLLDLLLFLDAWFRLDADFDGSGVTNIFDLLAFLQIWYGRCL